MDSTTDAAIKRLRQDVNALTASVTILENLVKQHHEAIKTLTALEEGW